MAVDIGDAYQDLRSFRAHLVAVASLMISQAMRQKHAMG